MFMIIISIILSQPDDKIKRSRCDVQYFVVYIVVTTDDIVLLGKQ